jgi:hypothetical protein
LLPFAMFSVRKEKQVVERAPSDSEKIVPVHALVISNLVVCAYATGEDHDAALLISSRVQKVVAFGTKVKGCLPISVSELTTLENGMHWLTMFESKAQAASVGENEELYYVIQASSAFDCRPLL